MRWRAFSVVAGIVATLGATAPARSSAAVFTVNTTADNASANCQGTGPCSIRGAITEANRVAGADTIDVPSGSYTLNSQNLGDLPISTDITITGASAATTTIGGDGKNARIFRVFSASGKATISHLRLTFASVVSLPTVADRIGGIVLVDSGATANLDHVRADNGQAVRGGGIAIRGATANITKSSIDNNHASQDGAGILNLGVAGAPAKLTLTDSTVASNTNGTASGVQSTGNTGNVVTVTRSTIAYNNAGSNGGTGLRNETGTLSVAGSILVENRGDGTPDNCGGTITVVGAGNVENFNKCGFALHDVDNTKYALLAQLPVTTFETPVLPIPAMSVAVNLAGTCTGADQRDLSRPQGPGCDAGAYEVDLPPNTSIDSGPTGTVGTSSVTFTFSSDDPDATFQCSLDGGPFTKCSSPQSYSSLANVAHTFSVKAFDQGGQSDPSPPSRSFTVDTTPPDTTITGGPSGLTNINSPSFSFGSEAGATFQCKLDGPGATTGSYGSCTSPKAYTTLADGAYTFSVRATDAIGNTDGSPATRAFTVDATAPDTTITGGPSGLTNINSPSFSFSSEAGAGFECKLDGPGATTGSYGSCTSPKAYTTLADGAYTFSVRAKDTAGNTDGSPATRTFTVDATPPDTTITGGPTGLTNVNSPSFSFNSEAGATLECKLDGPGSTTGSYGSCASPKAYTTLADGAYTFSVRAKDTAGNTDGSPATRAFTVDATAPDTTITTGPSGLTNNASPSFAFNSTASSSTFQCKLDGPGAATGTYATCTNPRAYTNLAQGTYTFSVIATDPAGNPDPTAATRTFTVDTAAPDTTITGGPTGATSVASPSFTLNSTEAGSTFQCKLDGPGATTGAYQTCTSPNAYGPLADGAYTLSVRAIDAATNTDATPATRAFTVDTTPPALTIDSGPTGLIQVDSATFAFNAHDATATVLCALDGAPLAACTSPKSYTSLGDGTHTFRVRATDPAGNQANVTQGFSVDTTAPDTTITEAAGSATSDTTPTFAFESTTAGATFTCKLDGPGATRGSFQTCTSPRAYGPLAEGTYTFSVRATDQASNTDPTPDTVAFVVDTTGPTTEVVSGPVGPTTNPSPAFAFDSTETGSTFACRLDGPGAAQGAYGQCSSPRSFSGLQPGDYLFLVRATDPAGNTTTTSRAFTVTVVQQATPTPTPTPSVGPAQEPTPVPDKSVVIQPVSGKTLVKLPGSNTFEPVDVTRGIPNGSTVDTKKGKIRLFAIPKAGKPAESALFYQGIFKLKLAGGITELQLVEQLAKCPSGKASAAAKKKPKTRKLWGDGSGSFRTRGQYSAATVRGTRWLVQDFCGKTLTKVAKGVVEVQDFVKKKKVLVRAPKSYTAKQKKR